MIRTLTLTLLACLFSIASFAVSPINGTDSVCVGSTRTLTDATSGGSWSSSDTSVATVNFSTGVVSGVAVGVTTITYMVGSGIATATFVVNPAAAPISGATTVSAGSAISLSDAVVGGTWTSNHTSVATVGSTTGLVTGISAGTATIYYVTAGGCGTYHIVTVTGSTSAGTISGTTSACAGNTSTLTDATSGGAWSSSNTSVATVGSSTGVVTAISAGTCTITYMVGTSIATITFTVNPEAPISGSTTVGVGGTLTLSDPVSGGTWITSNASIATVGSSTGVVTGIAAGTVNIYYRTSVPCYSYVIVTVTGSTSAGAISGTASACAGNTSTLTDATSGGFWSSSNTSVATVGSSTGVVTAISTGTCTITYMVGTSIATITFTVNPEAPISGSTTVGVGGTLTLSDPVSGGTWITSNASIATVGSATGIVTGIAAGTVNIYYRTSVPCYSYVIVTVTGTTSVHSITGTTSACAGNTSTLADSTAGGHWSSSNTSVAIVGSSTGIVSAISAGTCTITYMVGTSIATITFTVNPEAPISGPTTVGVGGTITLGDPVSGGTWLTSNASIATVGSTSGVVTGVAAGIVNIYYRTSAPCYSYIIVTVTATSTMHSISGTASVCVGSTRSLSDSTSGGHWSSSSTAIATVGSSTGIVTGVSTGTCTITYTVGTSIVTITFTVTPVTGSISGSSTLSAGSTITLSDPTTGGTWSSSNTSVATVGSTSGVVTGVSAGTATIYYITAGGCGAYHIITVTATSVHAITGTANVCIGSNRTLIDSTTGGHWSSSNTAIATVGSSTGIVTGIAAGTCVITYAIGTSIATVTVTVDPLAPITGLTTISEGTVTTFSDAVSGGTWLSSNTAIATVGSSTGIVTGVSAGTCTIYYITPGTCYLYVIVTVTGTSAIHSIDGTASICEGSTRTLTDSTSGGHWSSSNTSVASVGSSTGVVTGISAGTCTITYTVGTSIATVTFTVNAEAPITGSTTVATGGAIALADPVSGGSWISSNTSVATVGSLTGIVTGLTPGTTTIYYRTSTPCYSYVIVTVTATTVVHSISGTASVCEGSTRTLTDPTTGGHWSSSNTAIASVGSSTGVVTGVSAGTCTITYTVGASIVTVTFTVNSDAATVSGATTVSVGSTITLSDAVTGGIWSTNDTVIATAGATSGIITGVSAGTVTVYYVTPGGCYTYHIVTVTPSTPAPAAPVFSLYPNPASSLINVSWQDLDPGIGELTITDMSGHVIYTSTIDISSPAGQTQVPVSELGSGIYLFDITSGEHRTTGRLNIIR